jgi:hypothetical protein
VIRRWYENGLLIREERGEELELPTSEIAEPLADTAALGLVKSMEEHRVTIGVAYPANLADAKMAKDGHIDFASKDVVEQIAWRWMKERQQVGLLHESGTEGHGLVVESGIHRGPDWIVKNADDSETVVSDGDWLLGVEWDEPTWRWIKANPSAGYSPQGRAGRREPSAEALAALRSRDG